MKRSKNRQKLNKKISKEKFLTKFNSLEDSEDQWDEIFEILEEAIKENEEIIIKK